MKERRGRVKKAGEEPEPAHRGEETQRQLGRRKALPRSLSGNLVSLLKGYMVNRWNFKELGLSRI